MSTAAVVVVLVVIAAALAAWAVGEARRAPRGCDLCDGVVDCPNCGPLEGRTR